MEAREQEALQVYTIERWHQETEGGRFIPLRIPIHGYSMFPLVRYMKDYVTIVPVQGDLVVGDIVMFHDPVGSRYVLHRIIRLEGNRVLTRGDNCSGSDRPIRLEDVWGRAVLIERGKKNLKPDPAKGLRHARCWYIVGRGYRFLGRLRRFFLKIS